jgi:hypothetical protein
MPNVWIAVAALVSAMSAAWVILSAQGVPATIVVPVTMAGLAALGVVARRGRSRRPGDVPASGGFTRTGPFVGREDLQ